MALWKDESGNLYDDMGGEALLLAAWPAGLVLVADEDVAAILNPPKSLGQLQAEKVAELDAACSAAILAGFTSAALGTPHLYPAKPTDQANLQASVLSSMYPNLPADWSTPFWCANAEGEWAMRPHSATQIQQVGVDGKEAIIAAIQRKAGLEATVMAALTVEALSAVAWTQE